MQYLINNIEIKNDVVNITLLDKDNNFLKHRIHIIAYTNYYFNVNNSIDEDYLSNILKESNYYFIKDEVIKKLSRKDYSKFEIKEFISNKLSDSETLRLIKDLERNNYINDYNYVKSIFNDAQSKLKGKLYIEDKLNNKEIDENIIKAFFEQYNEEKVAYKLVNNEIKKLKDKCPKNNLISKISMKLNYNGFSEVVIYEQMKSLESLKLTDNKILLEKDYIKLLKKYQKKFENKDLNRKIIESLIAKGYNYKSIREVVEGKNSDD